MISFRLRPRLTILVVAAVSALCALGLAWLFGFVGDQSRQAELERLQAENRHLIASLAAMEGRTDQLARSLDDLAARDQRYRILAGLPLLDPQVHAVGIGGPGLTDVTQRGFYTLSPRLAESTQAVDVDLGRLLRRADLLAASLSEAADSMEARKDLLRTRPSIFPVASAEAWISSGFSHNRLHPVLGYRRPHVGLDISAPAGSPVVAAAGGRITFAGREMGYGRMVEIDHGMGYRTRYAHLARIHVRPGQRVERAAQLGEVGRSGITTGPNLHYEVLVDGRPVNPYHYLLDGSLRR